MSNICKTFTLRKRSIKNGTMQSFYLDYYPGYRDESTMKVQRHESLGIYIYTKPKNQRERDYNDNMTEKAEAIRCRRFESIVNERYDFFDKEKQKGDFLAYFKKKAEEKNTKWENVYKYFERFVEGKCTFGEITVDLHTAYRDHKIKENPNGFLDRIDTIPTEKEHLSQQELITLAETPCKFEVLKIAFLFSCLTGLRKSDIMALTWNKLQPYGDGGMFITVRM